MAADSPEDPGTAWTPPTAPAYPPTGPVDLESTPPARWDRASIAALASGIVGVVVAAIPLGIAGLVRTKGRARKGRGLAIAALAVSAVWLLVFGVIGAAAAVYLLRGRTTPAAAPIAVTTTSPPPAASPTPTVSPAPTAAPRILPARRLRLEQLKPGHCIERAPTVAFYRLPVVPCTQVHEMEVFATATLPRGPWPGQPQVDAQTYKRCEAAYGPYMGNAYADSSLDYTIFTPTPEGWRAGDRLVICVVLDPSERHLRTSLRGSYR